LVGKPFIAQGLICVKQYFKNGILKKDLAAKADKLWKEIDFD
jgi:hypothetical protein